VALSLLKEQVQTHKTAVQSAQDRLSVDNEAAHFLTTFRELESHTYYTLSLIKLGNMQVAYDKLKVTRDAVKAYVDTRPLSNTVRAEKQRGFDEIERNIQNADALFTPVKTEFYQQPGRGDLSSYSKLSTALNPVYAQINQVVQFLEEVKK
jgi:hypothetical protein